MSMQKTPVVFVSILVAAVGITAVREAQPCGGFFCQLVPIDQAGEQIIFRQDGNMVTAVVLIQYAGEAQDFSWVVPVPGIPELSTGSDLVFAPLELATRPQFVLERTDECRPPPPDFGPLFQGGSSDNNASDDGVEILQTLSVGPFDVQIVTSSDPHALATWLDDNGYDLTDRGRELIGPYVLEDKNFVAVRLRQDQGVGDIQPLIMRYESDEGPCIPIRLTAVAAQPDMGVLVWLVGSSRAVPVNYLHVTPNYTRLNWYAGSTNAYVTYQGLITAAMDEAGGQGFATDYAGRSLNLLEQLPTVEAYPAELTALAAIPDDAQFVAGLAGGFVLPNSRVTEILRRALPLGEGDGEFIYQVPALLRDAFTADQLAAARSTIILEVNNTIIEPLAETLAVLGGEPYVTRLYTTLSAEEMTVDPIFAFNPDLPDQALERRAKLDVDCGRSWSLTLGAGTGRAGERVIEGSGYPPGFFTAPPNIEQDSVWRTEMTRASGQPVLISQKQFPLAQLGEDDTGVGGRVECGAGTGLCGGGTAAAMLFTMLGLRLMRRRG